MFFDPIIGLIHNTATDTWHPILFDESPLPGPFDPNKPVRHKSKMHHTTGFTTREDAIENAKTDLAPRVGLEPKFALSKAFEWNGNGVPAMTAFFVENESGELVPVF